MKKVIFMDHFDQGTKPNSNIGILMLVAVDLETTKISFTQIDPNIFIKGQFIAYRCKKRRL